jgi:hypothetical protein
MTQVYKGVVPPGEFSSMVDDLCSGPCIAVEVRTHLNAHASCMDTQFGCCAVVKHVMTWPQPFLQNMTWWPTLAGCGDNKC